MLTISALDELGVNTQEGLGRCLNNEPFYFRLIDKAMRDDGYERLQAALDANDLDAAFELAHALKGVLGNLSLTPLLEPVSEMTELLRARTQTDYSAYMQALLSRRAAIAALCE